MNWRKGELDFPQFDRWSFKGGVPAIRLPISATEVGLTSTIFQRFDTGDITLRSRAKTVPNDSTAGDGPIREE